MTTETAPLQAVHVDAVVRRTPLAVELHDVKVMNDYPCGCKFWVLENGEYEHFVSPDCQYDKLKVGLEMPRGYFYKGLAL